VAGYSRDAAAATAACVRRSNGGSCYRAPHTWLLRRSYSGICWWPRQCCVRRCAWLTAKGDSYTLACQSGQLAAACGCSAAACMQHQLRCVSLAKSPSWGACCTPSRLGPRSEVFKLFHFGFSAAPQDVSGLGQYASRSRVAPARWCVLVVCVICRWKLTCVSTCLQ
jgi:hypothetical protein